MILLKKKLFLLFFVFSVIINLSANEFIHGNIKLTVNERAGNFSLFYLTDPQKRLYEPLFYNREPRSSYILINFNGHIHRLDKYHFYRITTELKNEFPVVNYEAGTFNVQMEFSPVKTLNSQETNGIKLTITIFNKINRSVPAGLRLLLDTHLGEEKGNIPFFSNNLEITGETRIESASGETFWVSKGKEFSLMGSIIPHDRDSKVPDYLHFANWRRLNNAPWRLKFSSDRSFSSIPYSIRDSAVSYYYEPETLESGKSFSYSIYLTTEDTGWYDIDYSRDISVDTSSPIAYNYSEELLLMYSLQATLNRFIAGEIFLNEDDLNDIEKSIDRLKTRLNNNR